MRTLILTMLLTALFGINAGAQEKATASEKNSYTCPMQCEGDKSYDKPGDCPKCGMALVK